MATSCPVTWAPRCWSSHRSQAAMPASHPKVPDEPRRHGPFGMDSLFFVFVCVFPSCPDFFWLVNTFDSIMSSSFILLDLSLYVWNFSGEAKPIGYIQRLILRNSPMWLWGLTSGKSGCSHRSWCCLESEICRTGQEVGNSGWIYVTVLRQDSVFSMKPRFLSEDHQLI